MKSMTPQDYRTRTLSIACETMMRKERAKQNPKKKRRKKRNK